MRTLYELCEKAEEHARNGNRGAAAAALAEAHVFIQPEVEKARMRLETRTLYGYLATLYRAAQACRAWLHDAPFPAFEGNSFPPSWDFRARHGTGNRSSLDFRWSKWREKPESWADVACRCPSL